MCGDVKIFIRIKNTSQFKRDGLDLIYTKQISLKEALCGFSFSLKHVDGQEFKLNNSAGNVITPTYKKIIKEFGMRRGKNIGNLVIDFDIKFPTALTSSQIKELENEL